MDWGIHGHARHPHEVGADDIWIGMRVKHRRICIFLLPPNDLMPTSGSSIMARAKTSRLSVRLHVAPAQGSARKCFRRRLGPLRAPSPVRRRPPPLAPTLGRAFSQPSRPNPALAGDGEGLSCFGVKIALLRCAHESWHRPGPKLGRCPARRCRRDQGASTVQEPWRQGRASGELPSWHRLLIKRPAFSLNKRCPLLAITRAL
jgi:hypothetical protein